MPFNNTKKNAQAKLAQVQEKLDALNDARSEANITLGDAVKYLRGNNLSKLSNAEKIYVGQNPASEILQTIGSIGVGAAGAYAAWTAAGFGAASTGAAISGLSGAAAIAAKLALLGSVGGMAAGVAVMGGIPIVLGVLTYGVMSTFNAKKFKKVEFMADIAIQRIGELTDATRELGDGLERVVVECSPNNLSDVRTVESISGALAQVVDIPITREQDDIPDEDALEDAYRKIHQEYRREELSRAYRRLREAVASLEYNRVVSAAQDILGIILR